MVKYPPTNEEMQETQIQPLSWEHLLEKEMATFQDFCLGNPKGRRAWWATVHGVAMSQTGLSTLTLIFKLLHV